jgi:hypothetical protein
MGTTLTGTTPQDTYDSLIKVTDNGPLGATNKLLTDGLGNDSAFYLGTAGVAIKATSVLSFNGPSDTTHSVGYDSVIDGAQLRGQLGVRFSTGSGSGTERMRIKSGGSMDFSATDAVAEYNFGYNRPTASNLLVNGTNNNKIKIQNSESDIVVLNSNGNSYFNGGNVGIGTSAPLQKLGIDGSIVLQSSTAATKSLIFRSPSSSWGPQNSRIDFIPADGVNASVDISLNLWNGSIGNTVETLRFPYTGGIKFPATQISSSDANTLDDYEEGTFTATLKGSVSDPTTPVTTTGYYTKIGNRVSVEINFSQVDNSGAVGEVQISGLPFTSNTNSRGVGTIALFLFDLNGASYSSAFLTGNTTIIEALGYRDDNSWVNTLHNAGPNRYLVANVTYFV